MPDQRVLVTNDDGIHSPGLVALAQVARDAGLEVLIAAPHEERSGSSASLTALKDDGRLVVSRTSLDGDFDALSVEATPAFISMVAARGAFGDPPDLVLSGVNRGPNTGRAILHSGTVGAVLTAAGAGLSGIAVSMAAASPSNWETAQHVVRPVLDWLLASRASETVINVNVPDVPIAELRGTRMAGLARFGAVQANIGHIGEDFVTIGFTDVVALMEEGTDATLLSEGWATVTALSAPCAAHLDGLDALESATSSAVPHD